MNNYRKYLQGHLIEVAREEKELAQKADLAQEKTTEIARQPARRFGVLKVCLFGFLATAPVVFKVVKSPERSISFG